MTGRGEDLEALAGGLRDILAPHINVQRYTSWEQVADGVLASPWLAARDRRIAAEAYERGREDGRGDMEALERRWRAGAWGEGYEAARLDAATVSRVGLATANPYRADRLEGADDE